MSVTTMETAPAMHDSLNEETLKRCFGEYPSGLTIVTTSVMGSPVGFTCQAFHSVSIDPPLVSFLVMNSSTTYPLIREVGRFAVNVLAEHQADTAMQFARKNADRWSGVEWAHGASGVPTLTDSLAVFECDLWAEHEAGDHTIVIGHVTGLRIAETETEPLVYHRSRFRNLR